MALSFKAGAFSMTSGATGNLSVTGVGFQPKAIIFFATKRAGGTDGAATTTNWSFGFAVSSSARGSIWCGSSNGGSNTSDSRVDDSKCLVVWTSGTPTNAGQADFVSFDADGFTLNRTTSFTASYRVGYMAFGGDDITDVACGTFAAPTTTGVVSYTGPGFQPDCLFLLGSNVTATLPANAVNASYGFGVATATQQFSVSGSGTDGSSGARKFCNTAKAFVRVTPSANTTDDEADLDAFTSSGFDLDWTKKSASAVHMFYLAIKGGSYEIGDFTTPGSATTFSESGLAFQPRGLIVTSACVGSASSGSTTTNDSMEGMIGAASGTTSEWSAWSARVEATGEGDCRFENDASVQSSAWGTGAVELLANLTTVASDGFTMTETDYPGYAIFCPWLAIGDSPPAAGHPTVKRWGGMQFMPGGSMHSPGRRRW